jgi:MFS family permease
VSGGPGDDTPPPSGEGSPPGGDQPPDARPHGSRDDDFGAFDEAGRLAPTPPIAPHEPDRSSRLLRHVVVDVGPLRRHRDFRLLWFGRAVSLLGSMVTYVAIPYQTYQISHSSLIVGLVSAAALVPLLTMALIGGAFADALDRRRLVLITEVAFAGASALLVANATLWRPQLWVLFVVAALMAALDGLQRPPLDALLPRLVERDELAAAGALSALRGTVGTIAGPALGGLLIAAAGVGAAYAFDVATFVVSVVVLTLMHAVPPPADAEPPSLRGILAGLRYAASRQELIGTYSVDIVAMFFGMPEALFPALSQHLGGASALGLLFAAPEVGSFLATMTSGWTARVHRHGVAVCLAAAGWGLGITLLGFAPGLALAVAALVIAGFFDMISGIFRMVIWNQTIPDRLRGRLAGIEQISYSSGPLLGNVESGVVASLAGVRASIASGGILCVAGVAVAASLLRGFWRYDSRQAAPEAPPPASPGGAVP